MELLDRIISERPAFHSGETEIARSFEPGESLLPAADSRKLAATSLTCHGIGRDVLRFIAASVGQQSRTLETGAGCSTLVFALRRSRHIAVTPSSDEIQRIRDYAEENRIGLDSVQFIAKSSDEYLPSSDVRDLDLVLLDGKHAFPWPIVDWFFLADRLRRGGLMLIDDIQLRSVGLLAEFMRVEPGWELARDLGKTLVFRKTRERVLDVAWHMQPWTVTRAYLLKLRLSGLWRLIRGR